MIGVARVSQTSAKVLRVGGAQASSLGFKRLARSLNRSRHRLVLDELRRTIGPQLDDLSITQRAGPTVLTTDQAPPAWMLWWDGFSTAPDIVRACVRSVEANLLDHRLVLLDSSNFENYTDLDGHLLDAFRRGAFGKTHLSDLIRMNLLKNNGGIWVDSTVFIPRRLQIVNETSELLTRRGAAEFDFSNVSQQRWAGYFMGGRSDLPIWHFMDRFFAIYWKTYAKLINYHLIDYGIAECYARDFGGARGDIDSLTPSSPDVHGLASLLSSPFCDGAQDLILSGRNDIFKLSWKSGPVTGPDSTHSWIVSDRWRAED